MNKAIISVSDKTGILEFAIALSALDFEILATRGTYQCLQEQKIPVTKIEDYTGTPELIDGKVKTLHPKIFAGILNSRNGQEEIPQISLVVVNLYSLEKREIDIGGCALIRAAAKNYAHVIVICDPQDYGEVIERLKESRLDLDFRKQLAAKAFRLTAAYDAEIALSLSIGLFPERLTLTFERSLTLSYGENPSQQAALYLNDRREGTAASAEQLQGKQLSFNNILDADAALEIVKEFDDPACVIVKHNNPCGVAVRANISEAFLAAYSADSLCAFGGIVAFNCPVNFETASLLKEHFLELVIAPDFTDQALDILKEKTQLRLLKVKKFNAVQQEFSFKPVAGGILLQTQALFPTLEDFQVVTETKPSPSQMQDLLFAAKINFAVKSNSIVVAKEQMTCGIGAGQMSRVDSTSMALYKAKEQATGAVLSSDGFFPFADSIEMAAKAGIAAIIQPGGSKKDQEVIDVCNRHGIAMVFTSKRLFKH